jgi:hypothetical protein
VVSVRIEVLAIFLFRNFPQCFLLDDFALRTALKTDLNIAMHRSRNVFDRYPINIKSIVVEKGVCHDCLDSSTTNLIECQDDYVDQAPYLSSKSDNSRDMTMP